ncbi:MAG: DUF1553 domain-containing protein [Pirellula sp.]
MVSKTMTSTGFVRYVLLLCGWLRLLAVSMALNVPLHVATEAVIADGKIGGEQVHYIQQIKPLLRDRCYSCHGGLKQESGLRLDTVELILRGGDSGNVISTSNVAESLLLKRVSAKDIAERMPPEHEGEPLSIEQVDLLKRWISAGATGPADEIPEADPTQHWSFQPVVRPVVSRMKSTAIRNPIDAFVEAARHERGLAAQPTAPPIVLLRRLYIDLLGVPPSGEEIVAFLNDPAPDRYEQLVERLLDDPQHGERWARHWMDIWRYSDWWGLGDQLRNSQKHIWHWRDWIVESLNEDMPYDEMIRLMLAADESHPTDLNKLRATGFLARNYFLFNRPQWMEETVEHVSKGFLGLTMNCAKCHNHKFDPLEQNDFYRMRAFFEPYHVRLDVVPGQSDLTVDGIPRAYDRELNTPTYRYIRGDEKNPDQSTVIAPAIPSILAFDELKIAPVQLPIEAWQPGFRPWVAEVHRSAAKQRVAIAEASALKARELLAEKKIVADKARLENAESKQSTIRESDQSNSQETPSTDASTSKILVDDKFATLDATLWKTLGGEWSHSPGRMEQKKDGASRYVLRLLKKIPRDFDATVRFTTLGGSRWRSVGLSFDVSQPDPTLPADTSDSEQTIYVSAVSGGSKVQASFHRGGKTQYPGGEAVRSKPIALNQEYTLRVQVRGSLVNATLDGEQVIAWVSPVDRRDGALELMTFDAMAVFHEVRVSELDPSVKLRMPSAAPPGKSKQLTPEEAVVNAQLGVVVADAAIALAHAELESVSCTSAAQDAERSKNERSKTTDLVVAAVGAERAAAVAKMRHALSVAEQALLRATTDKKDAAEKSVTAARENLEKAIATSQSAIAATDTYTPLVGAQWTPTRFLNSGKDDPSVDFVPTSTGRRTALANWITDRRNPLTARVAVNHIWTRHYGQSLVPTVFDFGRKGAPPTHPELLDWLASELIDSGWSMKHLHRLIVNSATYRLSSSLAGAEETAAKDPENRYLWRRLPLRIESQVVRDSLLSLAGSLDQTLGGPSIPAAKQLDSTRRSLYFFHSNNDRNLFLSTFDEALVKDCYRREQSIVPQQALALTNSRLVIDTAEKIATRMSAHFADDPQFVREAFRRMVAIEPSQQEITVCIDALHQWKQLPNGSNESARANFIWSLINHNDFVTLR